MSYGFLWLCRNPVGTTVSFSNSGKGRKTTLGNSFVCFGGAFCLLSPPVAKAPKGRRTATSLQMTFCQNVKTAPARTAQTGAGRELDGNARTSRARGNAGRKPKTGFRDILPPATERRAAGTRPRVSPAREMACKRTNEVCTRADSIQSGESLPKPCFSPLSAPARSALRQKNFVFAEGGSFLCGKRFCFYRKKTTAGTEKCSIQTVPPPVF